MDLRYKLKQEIIVQDAMELVKSKIQKFAALLVFSVMSTIIVAAQTDMIVDSDGEEIIYNDAIKWVKIVEIDSFGEKIYFFPGNYFEKRAMNFDEIRRYKYKGTWTAIIDLRYTIKAEKQKREEILRLRRDEEERLKQKELEEKIRLEKEEQARIERLRLIKSNYLKKQISDFFDSIYQTYSSKELELQKKILTASNYETEIIKYKVSEVLFNNLFRKSDILLNSIGAIHLNLMLNKEGIIDFDNSTMNQFIDTQNFANIALLLESEVKIELGKLTFGIKQHDYVFDEVVETVLNSNYNKISEINPDFSEFLGLFDEQRKRFSRFGKLKILHMYKADFYIKVSVLTDTEKYKYCQKRDEIILYKVSNGQKELVESPTYFTGKDFGNYRLKRQNFIADDKIVKEKILLNTQTYKFVTHFGANFVSYPNFLNPKAEYTKLGRSFGTELFLVHHKVGFYAGILHLDSSSTNSSGSLPSGKYFLNGIRSFNGGFYFAPNNYLYFKAGINSTRGNLLVKKYGVSNIEKINKVGFETGIMFLFPYFQFEGGYSFQFNSAFLSLGLNLYSNR